MIGKHQCVENESAEFHYDDKIYIIEQYTCIYCNRIFSGLDEYEIQAMPTGMARCKESPVKAGFMELLRSKVDCRGD